MIKNSKCYQIIKLIALNLSFYVSIRTIPTIAKAGLHSIFFIILSGILFAIPIALISAELATTWPEDIGPHIWVKLALGDKWSFITAWLLWIETFLGFIMICSGFATLISYSINLSYLGRNRIYIFTVILITIWIITIINLRSKVNEKAMSIAPILGIYLPYIIVISLGIWYAIKFGNINLGPITLKNLLPNLKSFSNASYFSAILYTFAGLEIASSHAADLDEPNKKYPKVIFFSILFLIVFNILGGLTEANSVPANDIQLASITQIFALYFNILNIPFATNILAFIIAFSVFIQLRSWTLRPSKILLKLADDGDLPYIFKKRSKTNLPITLILIQSIGISLLDFIYLIVRDVNIGFFSILILATIIYCIIYALLVISHLVLKYKFPNKKGAFSIPGGKFGIWFTTILALIGICLTMFFALIPCNIIPKNRHLNYLIFEISLTLISFFTPIILFRRRPFIIKAFKRICTKIHKK
ncbi:tyrosine-tyramine antiporter [Clostridium tarantellae]|uniref:tyrosine-tyramine antiporter n=1 Tax=Clostridium tarantellae TaxID=39493 RepID=UPI00128DC7CE|nr:tyrosine-tyramine antiporter [Clostridium tarantellae]